MVHDVTTERIRNVVLVGQSGAGKTTIAEALLARAGAIPRPGRVDDGTSTLDTEPEAVKRRMSLSLSVAPFEWSLPDGPTYRINLLDSPGYPDFVAEVEAGFAAADLALFVVSAVEGVEVQTEALWRRAEELRMPRMVFVNKEDKDRADFHRVLGELTSRLGSGFVALELPLGEAGTLHGVADVLSETALEYDDSGAHRSVRLPAEVEAEERQLHDTLIEEIVAGDDEQLEQYLAGEVPSVAALERTLAHEVRDGLEFPVLLGSALTGVGIDRLADFICELGPSPADRTVEVVAGDREIPVAADPAAPALLRVVKTIADPFVGQLSVFRVLSGTLTADAHLVNSRTGADERLHGLVVLRGREQTARTRVVAGDIAAVAKLAGTATGDTLAPKGMPVRVAAATAAEPRYAVGIVPRTQSDDDKLGGALARLMAEDPALRVDRVEQTRQTVLRGIGDTHVAVTLERLERKFGVRVDTVEVRVPYLETVVGTGTAEGKVKKQSGGHGQYAVAHLRVSPLERGAGFEFVDSIVGGAIPRAYIPAVQKGVEEAMAAGGIHGFPVVDVRVECFDGKFHSVDSSEMAFKTAAAHGLRDALAAAGVAVLEPISRVRVIVPIEHQGDVMSDVSTRRGRVQGTDAAPRGEQVVTALVPTSELARYAIDLRSMTGGRGRFDAEHDHYDVLPGHLVDKVKAASRRG